MQIPFKNTYARLPEHFYTRQTPVQVPDPQLVCVNRDLAEELGIDADWLESAVGVDVLSGNTVPEGAEPLSQVYAGHQFGGYSPRLGDGRAVLLGEVLDGGSRRRDIQLKGSGRTAFSRGGDGKSALGPVLREYLVSEAMYALGVPTTRALAAVTTGESVMRQEGNLAGGVFTRVASSHIRVGTFQYFYAQNDIKSVSLLADYAISRHFPDLANQSDPYLHFLRRAMEAQAEVIAQWMSFGFIHGVMNTDNSAVSGETLDYGPCAFMDDFHPRCVFSSIDTGGRYAWGNQPNIGLWNMSRLAETLVPLIDEDMDKGVKKVEDVLADFPSYFERCYIARFRKKLGLADRGMDDLIKSSLGLLAAQKVDFTLFFRRLTQVASGEDATHLKAMFSDQKPFLRWFEKWQEVACSEAEMKWVNPIIIPRNHRVEEAIQGAYAGDYTVFYRLAEALKTPFSERQGDEDLEKPPLPEERIRETFCGT